MLGFPFLAANIPMTVYYFHFRFHIVSYQILKIVLGNLILVRCSFIQHLAFIIYTNLFAALKFQFHLDIFYEIWLIIILS
jgi:hypothetical protein